MFNCQRIEAATDLSQAADRAVRRAVLLASQAPGRRLRMTHVLDPGPLPGLARRGAEELAALRDRLEAKARRLAGVAGLTVDVHLERGRAGARLLQRASSGEADLLVLGLAGASSLRRLILGSTSEALASRAPVPVLVVKRVAREPYRRVLVALANEAGVAPAKFAVAQLAPAAVPVLFHAYEVPIESQLRYASVSEEAILAARNAAHVAAMRRLRGWQREGGKAWCAAELCAKRGPAHVGILDAETKQGCDLVVVQRHLADRLERILLGSVSRRVLGYGRADVLVLPPSAEGGKREATT